jgi:hypothetical protein
MNAQYLSVDSLAKEVTYAIGGYHLADGMLKW